MPASLHLAAVAAGLCATLACSPDDTMGVDAGPVDTGSDAAPGCPVVETHRVVLRGGGTQIHRICFTDLPHSLDCYTSDEGSAACERSSEVGFQYELDVGLGLRQLRFIGLEPVFWTEGTRESAELLGDLPNNVEILAVGVLDLDPQDLSIGPSFTFLGDVLEIAEYSSGLNPP